ncbi:MAG: PhnD/SsuA/transferrin family substrate-binding protein [Planctomycetes bacterium]|nr:PhnD/SsuA/transferrin family substrate-binding protein [Planctomycetota bacterium]
MNTLHRFWPGLLGILALGVAVVGAFRLAGQFPGEARPRAEAWVDFHSPGPRSAADRATDSDGGVLRVAIAPVVSPEYSYSIYEDFVEVLARRLGRSPVRLQGKSYDEVNNMLRFRRCDLALICNFALIRGEQEFGLEPIAVPVVSDSLEYFSLVLVQGSSPARSLRDLQGKRFASADLLSASGWLYPMVQIRRQGFDPNTFFSGHVITGSHDRSLHAVVSGYVEGAAVDSLAYDAMVEEDPDVASKTRIIERSPGFGTPPIVAHPHIDPELKREIQTALFAMHEDEEGARALAKARIDRFVAPEDGFYDSVRELVAEFDSKK